MALLCYNSTYFDQKLNSEGDGTRVKLENAALVIPHGSPETFELVVQWMYTANLVLPVPAQPGSQNEVAQGATAEQKNAPESAASRAITSYLEFSKMANQIGLLGPFDLINNQVKAFLCAPEHNLLPCHIRSAMELPRGHAMRKLFMQACVAQYVKDIKTQSSEFRFTIELNEVEPFAADLLRGFNQAVRLGSTQVVMEGKRSCVVFFTFNDPLTGKPEQIRCPSTYR